MSGYQAGYQAGYGSGNGGDEGEPSPGERGYRRKRLAAMAGSVYRAGATAVNEIRETYAQQRAPEPFGASGPAAIPGAFPEVAITAHGDDQLVIFPSYAKQHVRQDWGAAEAQQHPQQPPPAPQQQPAPQSQPQHAAPAGIRDEDYWRREWERNEDERAIVDVDVRGWVYSPHKGPLTRKNRILLGLARHLSGIPAPTRGDESRPEMPATAGQAHESSHEQKKIAKQAAEIERRGQEEKTVAGRGGYSEIPRDEDDPDTEQIYSSRSGSASPTMAAAPGAPSALASPTLGPRAATTTTAAAAATADLSDAELAVANANLMARIAPFLTTPIAQQPISVFFYNETESKSKTVTTNEAGHFTVRAGLDFVPTHVRVLANERLSAIQEVRVLDQRGVSLISDIDDTVKRSNILAGTKEIFRNTFVRELAELAVDGVREWYTAMHQLGVAFHYCSNSPWQLFPVLASFFRAAGLPPGSLHLKQYSGMLQGIFEPVAERKKGTLVRILRDFPDRRFLLVGDSGEADLEVYTELATANPGRILAIFIRDVSSPEQQQQQRPRTGGFGSSSDSGARRAAPGTPAAAATNPTTTARFPDRQRSEAAVAGESGPAMGLLVDISDEPDEAKIDQSAALGQVLKESPIGSGSGSGSYSSFSSPGSNGEARSRAGPAPPPRPVKPAALRGPPSESGSSSSKFPAGLGISAATTTTTSTKPRPPLPPLPRRPSAPVTTQSAHPLSQIRNSSTPPPPPPGGGAATPSDLRPTRSSSNLGRDDAAVGKATPPPLPPPRRREAHSTSSSSSLRPLSPRLVPRNRAQSSNPDLDFEALPPSSEPTWSPSPSNASAAPPRTNSYQQQQQLSHHRQSRSESRSPSGVGSPVLGPTAAAAAATATAATAATAAATNKKLDLWRRRLTRAQETLDGLERQGHKIGLYTWRTGGDVVEQAVRLVKAALEEEEQTQQKLRNRGLRGRSGG